MLGIYPRFGFRIGEKKGEYSGEEGEYSGRGNTHEGRSPGCKETFLPPCAGQDRVDPRVRA